MIKKVDLQVLGDERGSLVAVEAMKEVPFDIQRVYYLFGTKLGVRRGYHAHKRLKQLVICVAGSCSFLLDDGANRESVLLDSPDKVNASATKTNTQTIRGTMRHNALPRIG
jgi:dTDP-4-dehydrorhamnose 3,5-epimerase-like enzyme